MVSQHWVYQLVLCALLGLYVSVHLPRPTPAVVASAAPGLPEPRKPKGHCSHAPKPFAGLPHKPYGALCEQATGASPLGPLGRPAPMPLTNRRPREIDTARYFGPHSQCAYRGGLGLGHLRANGHPRGGPGRQCHCTSCQGYFVETPGPLFHGKQAAVEGIVRIWACVAEGLGIRATARGFAVAPTTVWPWRGEAAEQLRAFAALCRGDLHLEQRPLDAWYAVLRARKAGEISDAEAITRLERASSWGWTAMAPGAHCWSCSMWAVAC